MRAGIRACIIGGTGYGGAELIRLLSEHPGVELARVVSLDHVGSSLEEVHLGLRKTGLVFENLSPLTAAHGMDVVFLALPHKVSAAVGKEISSAGICVVDLSGDFRLRDRGAYEKYYGVKHPHPEELGLWVYGLPELNRAAIRDSRKIASPGCFATAIALGLLPLAHQGLISASVQCVACTGSSGSGATPSEGTHHPTRANNLKVYKPLVHQHRPEIEQTLGDAALAGSHSLRAELEFIPVSVPLVRGILANSFVQLAAEWTTERIIELFRFYYTSATFVRVLSARQAEVVAIKGSMWVDLALTLGEARDGSRRLVVTTALDNLVKGGAGQAVQSMNLMFGLEEDVGLRAPVSWP